MAGSFHLNMSDGTTIWEKTPYKDPGGPNDGAPWYNQKFAWHLSPPSISDGKVYLGSFLPSFYAIFRPWAYVTPGQPGYPWPSIGNDATHYWVGRDGYFYGLDEDDGSIIWTWAPRGCGVTNIPPVKDGKVFIEADTATDYHYGYCLPRWMQIQVHDIWQVGTIPLAQGGTQAISGRHHLHSGRRRCPLGTRRGYRTGTVDPLGRIQRAGAYRSLFGSRSG